MLEQCAALLAEAKELKPSEQQLIAEVQTGGPPQVGRLLEQCASLLISICRSRPYPVEEPQAHTEASSSREEVGRLLAELASLRDARRKSEVAPRELESSKQQLVAEAQTEASSLREEVGSELAECTSLRAALSASEASESGRQQLVAEAQAAAASLREEVGRLSAECAWQQLALCESQAQTESSSLREEVSSQSAELTSLWDALGKSEVASRELEPSKQQLVAEAQTEASSLREEVRNQSADCTSLSPTLCRLLCPTDAFAASAATHVRDIGRVCYVGLPCCLSLLVLVSVSHCAPSVHYFRGYGILL